MTDVKASEDALSVLLSQAGSETRHSEEEVRYRDAMRCVVWEEDGMACHTPSVAGDKSSSVL